MANTKRINQTRETMFSGVRGNGAYQTGFDVRYRPANETDCAGHPIGTLQGAPLVQLIPVDRKSKPWHDRSIDIPVECIDELIQALEVIREEVGRDGADKVQDSQEHP